MISNKLERHSALRGAQACVCIDGVAGGSRLVGSRVAQRRGKLWSLLVCLIVFRRAGHG